MKKGYSDIQYFFWLMSGAEISIQKDCPTDYNRQAGIGFTIFMTTLFAFFSGTYAGWYFGGTILTAILFGTIWSALIFSIDRSMVITLKKNPKVKNQKFFLAFFSRAILAALIAFIISIPLELLVFKENIDLYADKYKLDRTYEVQQAVERNEAIAKKYDAYRRDSSTKMQIEKELTENEPKGDGEYDGLKDDYLARKKEHDRLHNIYLNAAADAEKARTGVPRIIDQFNRSVLDRQSSQWRVYDGKLRIRNRTLAEYNAFDKKGMLAAEQARADYVSNWIRDRKKAKEEALRKMDKVSAAIARANEKADTTKNIFEEKINSKNGFVLRFMILEDLASQKGTKGNTEGESIFMLLWLIRILFFTIEILPTVTKIATPAGAYDVAIHKKEEDFEAELEQKTSGYLDHQNALREAEYAAEMQQTAVRITKENELHQDLLTQIAAAQNEVALHRIEQFRKKHLGV